MAKKQIPKKKRKQRPVTPKVTSVPFNWKPALLLGLIAFLLYSNTLNHEFAFDDSLVITENKITQKGFAGIAELASSDFFKGTYGDDKGDELSGGRWRPLSLILIAAESQIFGDKKEDANGQVVRDKDGDVLYEYPASLGHWTNVLLYVLCILVLYYLLHLWFGHLKTLQAIPFVATLLFAVHPIHTEVVANIKSQDELLCMLFLVLSLITWHKWFRGKKEKKYLYSSMVFFFLSLLAKEGSFTYIGILPLIAWVIYKSERKDIIKACTPLWGIAVLYLVVRTAMVGLPQPSVATTGIMDNPFATSDTGEKLGTISLICWRYLLLCFAPMTMRADYSFEHVPLVSFSHPEALLGLVVYGALIVLAWMGLKKRGYLTLFILMFLFPLFIVTNLVFNIGATMGERFLFLPSLGFALAIAYLLSKYLKVQSIQNMKSASWGWGLLFVYCGFFAFKSFSRNPDWKNNDTLFAADVASTPKSAKMQNYQARILFTKWRESAKTEQDLELLRQAKMHYEKSVEIYPMFAMSLYDLGLVNLYLKDGDAAVEALHKSLRLNNTHGMTHELLGQVHYRLTKNYKKAISHLRYAVEKSDRKRASSLQDLGIYYATVGRRDSAVYYLRESLSLDPNNLNALRNASSLLNQMGMNEEAKKYSDRANGIQGK